MRKIKFKVKIKLNELGLNYHNIGEGNFIESKIHEVCSMDLYFPSLIIRYKSGKSVITIFKEHCETCELMQFSGLKDKNGEEIYEGDIIQLKNVIGETVLVVCEFGTVQREIKGVSINLCDITGFFFRFNGKATFPIVNNYLGKHDLELFEVIGNIHSNPELLK